MEIINYLKGALPKGKQRWTVFLYNILMSNSLQVGKPYNESLSFLWVKYERRMAFNKWHGKKVVGLADLLKKRSLYSESQKVKVYPMKDDHFSGECVIVDDKIIGCAFIERGGSFSKKGLWIDGKIID